jgi:protein-disulfide isomerase
MREYVSLFFVGFFISSIVLAKSSTPLFEYNGRKIYYKDLSTIAKQKIYEIEYKRHELYKTHLDNKLIDMYVRDLMKEGKNKGKSFDQIKSALLEPDSVSDKESKQWYKDNKSMVGKRTYESIKEQVKYFLYQKKIEGKRNIVLSMIKKKGKYTLKISAPETVVVSINTNDYPKYGKKSSPIKIIEFADYQCPHCKTAYLTLKKVLGKYKNKINFTYMDFPINPSGISRKIAIGAMCAHEQKKYWKYHDLAFDKQAELNKDSHLALAKDLKLNMDKFNKCMLSKSSVSKIDFSMQEAKRIGVEGTPVIYINGVRVLNHSLDGLVEVIEKVLNKG